MEDYNMQVIPKHLPYRCMDVETRKKLLPERNVCSVYPAKGFLDALYTGNGKQRIDVLGDPLNEYLSVSHELLYAPHWASAPLPPDYNAVMLEARKLLREGKLAESAALIDKEQRRQDTGKLLTDLPGGTTSPPGSLRRHFAYRMHIAQGMEGTPENYLRFTDLMSGESTVRWDTVAGAWARKALVSFRYDAVVHSFLAPAPGLLHAKLSVVLPGAESNISGPLGGASNYALHKSRINFAVSDDRMTITLGYNPEYGKRGNVTVIRLVRTGGKIRLTDQGAEIIGADSLMLLSRTVRFEENYDPALARDVEKDIFALPADYEDYLASNRKYLSGRMGLSRVKISEGDDWALSSEELMRKQHSRGEFNAALLEKLFDMGRFYQIIDSGELPPSYGQHNINTNLQVCAGNMTGLDKEMDVYFRFYESKFEDFRINAKRLFGARGILATIHCDYDSGLLYHSSVTYPHYCWTGCLGWIYNEFWGHYLVTGDRAFLRDRIIPALKEIALFFEDYAKDTDDLGQSIFYPSFSPENPSSQNAPGCFPSAINSVMDIMICREVLDNLIDGCTELGIEADMLPHWREQRARLPKYLLDEEGGLREWAWPTIVENYDHRHVSHHYDVWPGHAITPEDTPELAEAVLISNRKRSYQNDSAHGVIHRLFTAIRLKDGSGTAHYLRHLMEHGYVTRSFATSHNPYVTSQFPDLQGAMPAILAEMLVYSAPGVVELLPGIPGSISSGSAAGIWLFTFAKLEWMNWDIRQRKIEGELISFRDQDVVLRYRKGAAEFIINGKAMPSDGNEVRVRLTRDKGVSFLVRNCQTIS